MAPRFDLIKFNLVRAVEMFQDLNHDDMDVTAPPSCDNYTKESELAEKLDKYIDQLIDEGFFDDCQGRDSVSSSGSSDGEEDEMDGEDNYPNENSASYNSRRSTPRSAGFDYESETRSDDGGRGHSGSGRSRSGGSLHSRSRSGSERGSNSGGSSRSFGDRFKRYIKRILPGRRPR